MRLFPKSLLLLILTLPLLTVTRADDSGWTAWLHYGHYLVHIDHNGNIVGEIELPLHSSDKSAVTAITASPDARRFAYSINDSLTVYDLQTGAEVRLNTNAAAVSTDFHESGTSLAVALIESNTATIQIFELAYGDPVYRLEITNNPALPITPLQPIIHHYQGTQVIFSLMDENGIWHGFTWDTSRDSIHANAIYDTRQSDNFRPTGEVILPYADGLHVYDPALRGRYLFSTLRGDVTFAQNGARIVVNEGGSWALVNRDGGMTRRWSLADDMHISSVHGTPDGFIYTMQMNTDNSPGIPALMGVRTTDNTDLDPRIVWNLPFDQLGRLAESSAGISILWVSAAPTSGPFTPWAQLAAPIFVTTVDDRPTPQPTPIPPPRPVLRVGDVVTVQTLNGEILNLRSQPTTQSEILRYLDNGLHLTLLEGPIEADGFRWWRVRLPGDEEGWAAEHSGDMQTLIPD